MSLDSIKTRHEELKATKSTQSVKIVNELKSQAHKDRGELIELCEDLSLELQKVEAELKLCKKGFEASHNLVDSLTERCTSYELELAKIKEIADKGAFDDSWSLSCCQDILEICTEEEPETISA